MVNTINYVTGDNNLLDAPYISLFRALPLPLLDKRLENNYVA
jgi:hypothetical protein